MSSDGGLFGRIQSRVDEAVTGQPLDENRSFTAADLLDLDDAERRLVQLVMKSQPLPEATAGERLGRTIHELSSVVDRLVARGALVRAEDGLRVGLWRASRRSPGGIWSRLGDL